MRSLLAPGFLCCAILGAQTTPTPEVRLEPHDGKTTFQIGEPIRLDLVISNPTGLPMMVNATDYGDNSDPVEITPKTGWIAWQGQSGHDYAMMSQLGEQPVRIPIRIDQVAIFRAPGHYDVRVSENRVQGGADLMHLSRSEAITTNSVGLELEPMPESREADIVNGVEADLSNAGNDRSGARLRKAAVVRLAALQGNIALAEKVKLLVAEQEDFRGVATEAWATTLNLKHQLELIESAWHDPKVDPAYDMPSAMDETRRLLAGLPLRGWQMAVAPQKPDEIEQQLATAHQQDMVDLLNSMPQRNGENRRDAAYFLVEFSGLPSSDQARAREYAIQEFPQMNDVGQHMILETARPPVRDSRLLPSLKAMLDKDPADKDALAAYLDIAPDQAAPYVVRAVCAPSGPPLLDAFAKVKEDRLPQVDGCLHSLLQGQAGSDAGTNGKATNSGRANFVWKQRVTLAARFGSPALLPEIEISGTQQVAANPNDSGVGGALLAAEMRDNAGAALQRLQRGMPSTISWYETDKVFESAHQSFPAPVLTWLRSQVLNADADTAGNAAYQLSVGGTTQDRKLIEERLSKLRSESLGSSGTKPTMAETNLVSALFQSTAWTLTTEERTSITDGCLTDGCRGFAKH